VLTITGAGVATAASFPAGDEMASDEPMPEPPVGTAAAVSVTVTVERATVTVTGAQLPNPPDLPLPELSPAAPEGTARTVTYLVDVLVPVTVVVISVEEAAAPGSPAGRVA